MNVTVTVNTSDTEEFDEDYCDVRSLDVLKNDLLIAHPTAQSMVFVFSIDNPPTPEGA